MDILGVLTAELGVKMSQVEAAVKLIDEGNTIPFIARYRKEVTGSLNDEVLRNLDERLRYLRNLEEKKTQVVATLWWRGRTYTCRSARRERQEPAWRRREAWSRWPIRSCCR